MNQTKPAKLGMMRVFQVCYIINILFMLFTMTLLSKDLKPFQIYGFSWYLQLINMVCDGISFWLIWKRKRLAIPFILINSFVNIAAGTIYNLSQGSFGFLSQIFDSIFDIILILYFLLSKRPKQVLTEPFRIHSNQAPTLMRDQHYFHPTTWPFWRNLIIYFCVFSIVGHWAEAFYCTLQRFGLLPGGWDPTSQIWSDWLYPFPVYGIGAVFCVLLFYPIRVFLQKRIKKILPCLIVCFVVSCIICSLIELVMGLTMNTPPGPDGKLPLWDYSDRPFNFMGQVCLQNSIAFGLVATAFTWMLYPALEGLIAKASHDVMQVVFVAVIVFFGILDAFYLINVLDWKSILNSTSTDIRLITGG